MKNKRCLVCNEEFVIIKPMQKFCSKICSLKYRTQSYVTRWNGCNATAKRLNLGICSKEEMKTFFEKPHVCEYCSISESKWLERFKRRLEVDRKDSKIGYTIDNITWACHRCNTIKNNLLTYEEMKEIGQKYIKPKWQNPETFIPFP